MLVWIKACSKYPEERCYGCWEEHRWVVKAPGPPEIKLPGALKSLAMSRTEAPARCRIQRANLGPGPWVLKPRRAHPAPTEHLRIMLTIFPSFLKENVTLIKEINELRRELKLTRSQVYDLESALKVSKKARQQEVPESGNTTGGWAPRPRPSDRMTSFNTGSHLPMVFWSLSKAHTSSPEDLRNCPHTCSP